MDDQAMDDQELERALDELRTTGFGRLLALASDRYTERTRALLGVRGHALTAGQAAFLPHVGSGGARLTEVAARAGMTKQSASEVIAQLIQLGYLVRTPDRSDKRAQRVSFTDKGRGFLDAARAARQQLDRELRQLLGPEGATALTVGLRVYARG